MDRGQVRDRIKRAVAAGRISAADAEIRLRNVESASSDVELDLIVRDLDQLDAAIPLAAPESAEPGRRNVWPLLVTVIVMVVAVAAAVGVFVASVGGDSTQRTVTELGDPHPIASASPVATDEPTAAEEPANRPYALSPAGVRTFLQTYRARFGTTRAVSATFYADYVIVQVPVAGKARSTGWTYRQASGFTEFGGTRANFPGAATVDLARLDVAKMFANIARAKRTLNVEDGTPSHVNIDYRPQFDPAANVNIYLSNSFGESGYLATRLDGRVERAYPYGG